MRLTNLYAPTLRETPAEAEIASHRLMLRAGMIRKAAGGMYTYLPLAWRVLRKIEDIVRDEMDRAGGQELAMPVVQPAEMWRETGRWSVYGDEMFRLKDRGGRDFCLGPTHEEMITTLVRADVRSYRQLPLMLYQIQNKYRDEIRPRFGLMRGREFIMKDLYSFDRDEAGLEQSYQKMYQAYTNIFARCGLDFRAVEADSGAIGGSGTHEFMAVADAGEAAIVYCDGCNYAANVEKAELAAAAAEPEAAGVLEAVATPGAKTIQSVAEYLKTPAAKTIKALAYKTEQGLVMALLRGDHTANEIKIRNQLGCVEWAAADERDIVDGMGSRPGFIGPVGLPGKAVIVADQSVMGMYNAVCGANQADRHFINVNPGRDFQADIVADIRLIQESDACPRCGAALKTARGIEVGQVFKLHTKYSEALKAMYLDEDGKEKPLVMGCYGIGVSRAMAAAIEQNNDADGIVWPTSIAPYSVAVIPVNAKDQAQVCLAEKIYDELRAAGVETVLDDRKERPGVKFKDADLIGYPLRVTIGPKAVAEDRIELKVRRGGATSFCGAADYLAKVRELLAAL